MLENFLAIDELRRKLNTHFTNERGKLIVNSAVGQINSVVFDNYKELNKDFIRRRLDDDENKRYANYLRKVDEDCKVEDLDDEGAFEIAYNTLNNFLKKETNPDLKTLHILCLSLNFFGWYHFLYEFNNGNLEESDNKKNEQSVKLDKKSTNPILKGILGVRDDLKELTNVVKVQSKISNGKENHIDDKESDEKKSDLLKTKQRKILGAIITIVFILGTFWIVNLIFQNDRLNPFFSSEDKSYKVLVLPFKNYNTGYVDVGGIIADRLKDLNIIDSLESKTKYWDRYISSEFDIDSANYWKKFHNADLIIFGNYLAHNESVLMGDIQLKYIGNKTELFQDPHERTTSNFRNINLSSLDEGELFGDIDFMIYFFSAIYQYRKRNFKMAIKGFLSIRNSKNSSILDNYIGIACLLNNDYVSAEKYLKQSLQQAPSTEIYINLGSAQFLQGKIEDAFRSTKAGLKIDSLNPALRNNLASLFFSERNYHKVHEIAKQNLSINNKNLSALLLLGEAKMNLDSLNESRLIFEELIELNYSKYDSYVNLAKTYYFQEDYKTAIKYYNKSLNNVEVYERGSLAYLGLGNANFSLGNIQEAITNYNKVIEIDHEDYEVYLMIGNIYFNELGDIQNAKDMYQNVIRIDSNHSEALLKLGSCELTLGNYIEARHFFEKLSIINPHSSKAFIGIGSSNAYLSLLDEAKEGYQKALNIDPNNSDALAGLGHIELSLNNPIEALNFLQQAVKHNNKNSLAWFHIASINYRCGKWNDAFDAYSKVIEINPISQAYNGLGNVYFVLNKDILAKESYENAILLYSEDTLSKKMLRIVNERIKEQSEK